MYVYKQSPRNLKLSSFSNGQTGKADKHPLDASVSVSHRLSLLINLLNPK